MKHNPSSRLFVFEGVDGTGKTTLARALSASLSSQGISVLLTSFPGKDRPNSLGKLIYDFHHSEKLVDPTALQMAHVAAHVDSIAQCIRPALESGQVVILDRYWWSTVAYAEADDCDMAVVFAALEAERLAWDSIEPDLIFLVDRKPEPEVVSEHRTLLQSAYDRLAKERPEKVRRVSNDLGITDALVAIREQIASSIGGQNN